VSLGFILKMSEPELLKTFLDIIGCEAFTNTLKFSDVISHVEAWLITIISALSVPESSLMCRQSRSPKQF
jgi:hypothetical protein